MSDLLQIIARGSLRERLVLASSLIGGAAVLHLADKIFAGVTAAQAGLLP